MTSSYDLVYNRVADKSLLRSAGITRSLVNVLEGYLSIKTPYVSPLGNHLPRHYHTVDHARRVFNESCPLVASDDLIIASYLFAMYHDVVYLSGPTRASENASYEMFVQHVADGWITISPLLTSLVGSAILASANYGEHQPHLIREVECWLDADLAGLADPWHEFATSTINVRREFFYVEDDQFVEGRKRFCKMMIERCKTNSLYYITKARTREASANLMRELDMLESGWHVSSEGWKNASGDAVEFGPDTETNKDVERFDAETEADLLKGLEPEGGADAGETDIS